MAKKSYDELLKKARENSGPTEAQMGLWKKSMVTICNSLGQDLQEVTLTNDSAYDLVEAKFAESPHLNPEDYDIVKGVKPPEDVSRIGEVTIGEHPTTFNVEVVIGGKGFCVYVYPAPIGGNQRGG